MDSSLDRDRAGEMLYEPKAFERLDETDDAIFYSRDRLVPHLDAVALETVRNLVGRLVIEPAPRMLDLMASWDSHLPPDLHPARVVGLGLNRRELEDNRALDERIFHDLNAEPRLPFADASFDVVLNVVSVDYLTRPFEIFEEVRRVLVPGGLYLVVFSNRMFPQKAVRVWRESSEEERVMIVEDYFRRSGGFDEPTVFISKGRKRPEDDQYAAPGRPSDPIYAVYAERAGGPATGRPRPRGLEGLVPPPDTEELRRREAEVGRTLRCPHCSSRLKKYRIPLTPFTEWNTEFLYVCFDDECPYLLRGWEVMARQGNVGFSYRVMFNPETGAVGPLPVQSLSALRDGIEEEDEPEGEPS